MDLLWNWLPANFKLTIKLLRNNKDILMKYWQVWGQIPSPNSLCDLKIPWLCPSSLVSVGCFLVQTISWEATWQSDHSQQKGIDSRSHSSKNWSLMNRPHYQYQLCVQTLLRIWKLPDNSSKASPNPGLALMPGGGWCKQRRKICFQSKLILICHFK